MRVGRMQEKESGNNGEHCGRGFIFRGFPPVSPLQASCTQVLLVGGRPLRRCLRALDLNNEADKGSYSKQLAGVFRKRTNNQTHVLICSSCREHPW